MKAALMSEPMTVIFYALVFVVVIGIVIWLAVLNVQLTRRRGLRFITAWTAERGWALCECRFDFIGRGPHAGIKRGGDRLFWAVVDQGDGLIVEGWVRCNVGRAGRYAGRVEPLWDVNRGFAVVPIQKMKSWEMSIARGEVE